MYFKQIQTPGLGCYSYVIGCPAAGECIVVDPKRDVQDYLDISREEGMRIIRTVDTHVHADHVSGCRELASRTGCDISLHEDAGVKYNHIRIADGDTLEVGAAKLEFLHTPGHTPNSLSILVTDKLRGEEPWMILTGDALFVGDIGRPDLPGDEILDEQVANLYKSLYNKLSKYPDYLEVYPGHGAGSLCGRGMSPKGVSTLGFERRHNPMLQFKDFISFKEEVMSVFPFRPKSFSHIIATNINGAGLLEACPMDRALNPAMFEKEMQSGALVIDTRDASSYGGFHIPGSLSIGFEKIVANWLGTVVDPDAMLLLVVDDKAAYDEMTTILHRIGYDNIVGYLAGGINAWLMSGRRVEKLEQLSVHELNARLNNGGVKNVFDVRTTAEWSGAHINGVESAPLHEFLENPPNIPKDEEIVVTCGSGYRSNIAGSYLIRNGWTNVKSMAGGLMAWGRAGFGVV